MQEKEMTHTVSNKKVQRIVQVAIILSIATLIEFVIAFMLHTGTLKTAVFIALTILKAFYIVGEFMHLSHERKSLIWSIVFPVVFIALLVFILLYESDAVIYAP